jgi:hypothetical protein
LYPSFTANTLTVIEDDAIITNKFASLHPEFKHLAGKSFKEVGITKLGKHSG